MFHPIEELEEHLVEIASILAREDPITIQSVQSKLREYRLSGWTEKQSVKAVLRIATHYRKHGQLGRFRVALLTGTTMFGSSFVTKAERTGLLLSDETGLESFRRFLTHFAVETGVSVSGDWRFLQERLHTYLAYEQLVVATAAKQRTVLRLLRVSPREAIKKVLALTQLRFLSHIDFPVPSHINEWLNEFGPPEELASIASLLVALANKFRPLDSIDFAFPLTADIASAEMRRLMECGSALHQRYEVAKDISLFG